MPPVPSPLEPSTLLSVPGFLISSRVAARASDEEEVSAGVSPEPDRAVRTCWRSCALIAAKASSWAFSI
ncbi:hypothetical protein SA13R_08695 [Rothia kristinae]|nr:hypothetical protein SA13R_08695 [Rothia kristinae]